MDLWGGGGDVMVGDVPCREMEERKVRRRRREGESGKERDDE